MGGERIGLAVLPLVVFVCASIWDPLLAFVVEGNIAVVTVSGGGVAHDIFERQEKCVQAI